MKIYALLIFLISAMPWHTCTMSHDEETGDIELHTSRTPLTRSAEILRNSKEEKVQVTKKKKSLCRKVLCCSNRQETCACFGTVLVVASAAATGVLLYKLINGVEDLQAGADALQAGSDDLKAGCNETRVACERLQEVCTICIDQFAVARKLIAACVENCSDVVKQEMTNFLNSYDFTGLLPEPPNVTVPMNVNDITNNLPPVPTPPLPPTNWTMPSIP